MFVLKGIYLIDKYTCQ